jgi:hypothetical protein
MALELPNLPPCPYHGDEPPRPLAECGICWDRFYFSFDNEPKLRRINAQIDQYFKRVGRARQYIALRKDGFETDSVPPRGIPLLFALPNGETVTGRNIDDLTGGTYPVRDNAEQTPIDQYLGWKCVHGTEA